MEHEIKHQIGYIDNGGIRIQTPCFLIVPPSSEGPVLIKDELNAPEGSIKIDGNGTVIIKIPDYWTEKQKETSIFTYVYAREDGKIFPMEDETIKVQPNHVLCF